MKRNKEVISVSTDIAGLLGKPDDVAEVYSDCRGVVDFGLEVICWQHVGSDYIQRIKDLGLSINGLHGPIEAAGKLFRGSLFHQLKGVAVDTLMVKMDGLPKISKMSPGAYVLTHERVVNSPEKVEVVSKVARNFDPNAVFLVENMNGKGSLERTVTAVRRLSDTGITTGMLIDLTHLMKDTAGSYLDVSSETIDQYWQKALERIRLAMTEVDLVGFHIPVGTNPNDSLPFEDMEFQRWVEFANLTTESPSVRFKTIENQRPDYRTLFPISRQEMRTLRERNFRIITRLHQAGVI